MRSNVSFNALALTIVAGMLLGWLAAAGQKTNLFAQEKKPEKKPETKQEPKPEKQTRSERRESQARRHVDRSAGSASAL